MSNEAPKMDDTQDHEQFISDYLEDHPDFFVRHGELISKLKIPHSVSGDTTSLVERQMSLLRQRNQKLDGRLGELIKVAEENNELAERIHELALSLIGRSDLKAVLETVEAALREQFAADDAVLLLFHAPELKQPISDTHFCRSVPNNLDSLGAFSTFMRANKSRCGNLRDTQREFLFGDYAEHVASAALVPLGKNAQAGMLAVGSKDPDHFNPAMGTEFLDRIGSLLYQSISSVLKK